MLQELIRLLISPFLQIPNKNLIDKLLENFQFEIKDTIISAELPDNELTKLVSELFQIGNAASITLEDLPVEDTMRSFFLNPENFL